MYSNIAYYIQYHPYTTIKHTVNLDSGHIINTDSINSITLQMIPHTISISNMIYVNGQAYLILIEVILVKFPHYYLDSSNSHIYISNTSGTYMLSTYPNVMVYILNTISDNTAHIATKSSTDNTTLAATSEGLATEGAKIHKIIP